MPQEEQVQIQADAENAVESLEAKLDSLLRELEQHHPGILSKKALAQQPVTAVDDSAETPAADKEHLAIPAEADSTQEEILSNTTPKDPISDETGVTDILEADLAATPNASAADPVQNTPEDPDATTESPASALDNELPGVATEETQEPTTASTEALGSPLDIDLDSLAAEIEGLLPPGSQKPAEDDAPIATPEDATETATVMEAPLAEPAAPSDTDDLSLQLDQLLNEAGEMDLSGGEQAPPETDPPTALTHDEPAGEQAPAEASSVVNATDDTPAAGAEAMSMDEIDQMLATQADMSVTEEFDTPEHIFSDNARDQTSGTEATEPIPDNDHDRIPSDFTSERIPLHDNSFRDGPASGSGGEPPPTQSADNTVDASTPPAEFNQVAEFETPDPAAHAFEAPDEAIGFSAVAQDVADELDEQPQAATPVNDQPPKRPVTRIHPFNALKRVAIVLNAPFLNLTPQTRDAIGYIALIHIFLGSAVIAGKVIGVI